MNLCNKANNPNTSQKSFWKIINRVMHKCRTPKIPPLLVSNLFILNCREKARLFNDYFNDSINYVTIENDEIISLIRKINPNKATGRDDISGQMLCDESLQIF